MDKKVIVGIYHASTYVLLAFLLLYQYQVLNAMPNPVEKFLTAYLPVECRITQCLPRTCVYGLK